jgi:hypothetical protein
VAVAAVEVHTSQAVALAQRIKAMRVALDTHSQIRRPPAVAAAVVVALGVMVLPIAAELAVPAYLAALPEQVLPVLAAVVAAGSAAAAPRLGVELEPIQVTRGR